MKAFLAVALSKSLKELIGLISYHQPMDEPLTIFALNGKMVIL